MTMLAEKDIERFDWQAQPAAASLIDRLLGECSARCPAIEEFARRLLRETGTRLVDWVDHVALPADSEIAGQLGEAGFERSDDRGRVLWRHPAGAFPAIEVHPKTAWRLVLHVESVADFLVAQRIDGGTPIKGDPWTPLRKARVASQGSGEFWVVERHGARGWEPVEVRPEQVAAALRHHDALRRRRRHFAQPEQGFDHALALVREAAADLGTHWACDLFFAAEREYWMGRNRASRVQKARQDLLGLGWANHDHHTYRSSRVCFHRLVAVLEALGLECRERFYAGREAGWGAQVLEQPVAGIVVFADVDLAPEEVFGDFAHQEDSHSCLSPAGHLGTVGLWCRLHGEAFLEAGMHHLECRFDFQAARNQLERAGIHVMPPFTDLPYLRQAFTEGAVWPVEAHRISAALGDGAITPDQARQFAQSGALGSHLELLQRDQGYKGFNKVGINAIIRATDPRGERNIGGWVEGTAQA